MHWGYGAVIVRSRGHWQGFFIPNPADVEGKESVDDALRLAEETTKDLLSMDRKRPIKPLGALAGTLVELMYEGDWARIATLVVAISRLAGSQFWIVVAEPDGAGGWNPNFEPLAAKTIDEARDMINALGKASQVDLALKQVQGTN